MRKWTPLGDGKYCAESPDGSDEWCIKVTDDGDSIWQYSSSDDEWTEIGSLSFWGYRLCRLEDTPPQRLTLTQKRRIALDAVLWHFEAALVSAEPDYIDEMMPHINLLHDWLQRQRTATQQPTQPQEEE